MLNPKDYIYSNPDSEVSKENNLIPFVNYKKDAPERCLDMLLAKYRGESYQSEVLMNVLEATPAPGLKKKLEEATIMLITDGGLVPIGNPDRIPSVNAGRFGAYRIDGKKQLEPGEYEVSHQGYENGYVEENPNRLLPVDVLRELETEGKIGKLCDIFLSTTGVMTTTERSKSVAEKIAVFVEKQAVDAVILTSACGTSTRCGSYIALAIEEKGIPVVQVANLNQIAQNMGVRRVVKGSNVCYPFGNPKLLPNEEYDNRKKLLLESLKKL